MTFLADIRSWDSVAAFEAHLAAHSPAVLAWADGIVWHHTAVPAASWAPESPRRPAREWDRNEDGLRDDQIRAKRQAQLAGIMAYYRDDLGWDRGPHLFIDDRSIWQMTPLDTPGIHAIGANHDRIGIEVVGDFTRVPWPAAVARLALGAGAALLRRRAINVNNVSVRGHRDYNKPSCPGNAIDLDDVRLALAQINSPLSAPPPVPAPSPAPTPQQAVTPDSLLLHPPRATLEQLTQYLLAHPHGAYTTADVRVILGWYVADCTALGLDPLLVVAQLIHETGNLDSFWAARPRRNPAGIGVTGEPGQGVSFPNWKESVIAHTGRLLAYALPLGTGTPAQEARIAAALRYRALSPGLRGRAPSLRGLAGTWAADLAYADKLARVATAIQES